MANKITKVKMTEISKTRKEPSKLLKYRLDAFTIYKNSFNPTFGPFIDFDLKDLLIDNCGKRFDNSNDGYIYCDINTAILKYNEVFFKYFNKLIDYKENKFTSLNTAFFTNGVFIYVKEGIKCLNIINNINTNQLNRSIIVLEPNSELEYEESYTDSESYLNCNVIEVFVENDAKLTYNTIQDLPLDVNNLIIKRALVSNNSKVIFNDINNGSSVSMTYPTCILRDNAYEEYNFFVNSSGQQIKDVGYKVRHKGKNSISKINIKTRCNNGGSIVCRSSVIIDKDADNSISDSNCSINIKDSNSSCDFIPNNVLLNNTSIINHIIKNDDVFQECDEKFKELVKKYEKV